MRVAVIGAGIVGVTTAYELASDGHQVTVFERHAGVASETSFANAGVLAPGYVSPWAAPGMPWKVLSQLGARDAAVRFGGWNVLRQLPWLWRWWRSCAAAAHRDNRAAMQSLAAYSRRRLQQLSDRLNLDYEQAQGYLVLLRGQREADAARQGARLLDAAGVPHHWLDAAGARRVEPGLSAATELVAALHLPQDGVGNCRQFAHLMRQEGQRGGVRYRFEHVVGRLRGGAEATVEWVDPRGRTGSEAFDGIVLCAGHRANELLRPIGLRLPLLPVYGYSVTAPLRADDGPAESAPRSALMDERYKVAVSRLGQRVRVAGSAELGGDPARMSEAPLRTLYRVLEDWFPAATRLDKAQAWKGARPMLPDGPPVLGPSGIAGIWLNLGHGSSGWALACGSARVIADLIGGRHPDIDATRLHPDRVMQRRQSR